MIIEHRDYKNWVTSLTKKERALVMARLERIEQFGHFGDAKSLGQNLCELRWKNGWRVYFTKESSGHIVLLIGGHKNEPKKNIAKARILIERYSGN